MYKVFVIISSAVVFVPVAFTNNCCNKWSEWLKNLGGDEVEISNNIKVFKIEDWYGIEKGNRFYYDFGDNFPYKRVRILLTNSWGGMRRTKCVVTGFNWSECTLGTFIEKVKENFLIKKLGVKNFFTSCAYNKSMSVSKDSSENKKSQFSFSNNSVFKEKREKDPGRIHIFPKTDKVLLEKKMSDFIEFDNYLSTGYFDVFYTLQKSGDP